MTYDDILTDAMIKAILEEPKYISKKVRISDLKPVEGRPYLKGSFDLECEPYQCNIIVRKNIDNPLDFSVILRYTDRNRNEHILLRMNGNHGKHRNIIENTSVKGPHIHYMTERYQLRGLHPDGYAESTDRYQDVEGAFRTMMDMANIRYSVRKGTRGIEEFL